jgi:hypothetical protein
VQNRKRTSDFGSLGDTQKASIVLLGWKSRQYNYGLAADVVPYLSGQSGALNWKAETEQY